MAYVGMLTIHLESGAGFELTTSPCVWLQFSMQATLLNDSNNLFPLKIIVKDSSKYLNLKSSNNDFEECTSEQQW